MTTRERLPMILLGVLLLGTALVRSRVLTDDRTWFDEKAALLQAHAQFATGWPPVFHRADVYGEPSVGGMLRDVGMGDYPPGFEALIFALRFAGNPIRTMRWTLFLIGLALLVATYYIVSLSGNRWTALFATMFVAASLTQYSQLIKWTAVAPFIGLVAAALQLRASPNGTQRIRWGYTLSLSALLYTHYLCVAVLLAHAAYVFLLDRPHLRRQLKESAVAVASITPWLIFALRRQVQFAGKMFSELGAKPSESWAGPATVVSTARGLMYDLAVSSGLVLDSVPARYFAPLIVLALFCVVQACRSRNPETRRLSILAVSCMATAAFIQTTYTFKMKTLAPLTPLYFAPWVPLWMIAIVLGAAEIRMRAVRISTIVVLLAVSVASLVVSPISGLILADPSPRDYAAVCTALKAPRPDAAFFHGDEVDAKVMNISCRIDGWQVIGAAAIDLLPPDIRTIIVAGNCEGSPRPPAQGWLPAETGACVNGSRVTIYPRKAG